MTQSELPPELRKYPRKPEDFQTIKQETDADCGAAVAAMAVGVSLAEAKNAMRAACCDGHLYYKTREIARYLACHGILMGISIELVYPKLTLLKQEKIRLVWRMEGSPAILAVKSENFVDQDHFVLWDGSDVRDPNPKHPETRPLVAYDVLEIYPLTWVGEDDQHKWNDEKREEGCQKPK